MNRGHSHSTNSSPKYLFNLIDSIEKTCPVDNIELLDGTKVWNLIRVLLYFYPQKMGKTGNSGSLSVGVIWNLLKEGIYPLQLSNKKIEVCGFSGTESRKLRNGTYFDIYMDPLSQIFPQGFFVFEWANEYGNRRDYNDQVYSVNYIPLHIPIFSKTFLKLVKHKLLHKEVDLRSPEVLNDVLTLFHQKTDTDLRILTKAIIDSITVFNIFKNFFLHILKEIQPKMIFIRCGYGRLHMALSQASKELGIPSIELQHGIISKYHVGYVKKQKSENMDCIPEYLLTYGGIFTNIVKQGNLFSPSKVITAGFPYLEKVKNSPPILDDNIKKFVSKYDYTIFVTSQWTVAKTLKIFVEQLSIKLNKSTGIIFKPHPRDYDTYSSLQQYENIYITSKYDDTYEIFKIIDVHSTAYSTSGLESLVFGKPNIFIETEISIKNFFDVVDNKSSFIVHSPSSFLKKLEYIQSHYSIISKLALKKSENFFYPNSLNNIKKIIYSII